MRKASILRYGVIAACAMSVVPAMVAQTNPIQSIQLFGPVDVRTSADGASVSSPDTFNSATLNLTCPASPTATLSSANTGNVLVDNYIQVSVSTTPGGDFNTLGPLCQGGTKDSGAIFPNCFTSAYQGPAGTVSQTTGKSLLDGDDPDSFVNAANSVLPSGAAGGIPPIDISSQLVSGPLQLKVDLVDTGGFVASSTIVLNTNCTQNGVSGPATIGGNPIPQTNPTPAQLTQNFPFNPTTDQKIQFTYDLSVANAANTLTIADGTIPATADMPFDPNAFPTLVAGTSFATSSCLIHSGELINGNPACKLFTLTCTVGTGSNGSGAQCPVSSLPNEIFQDVFDGPAFSLSDIPTHNGPTFHEGIGFLMASEDWTLAGGPCIFDPAANLQNLPCPQNLLTSFSGPGIYSATGSTSHPNSTFVPIAQVPEDLTTVTVAGQLPGFWVNTLTPSLTLSSQFPVLTGTSLPGLSAFVPSPIQSITYGISAANTVPTPGTPVPGDNVVTNSGACQSPADTSHPVFSTGTRTLNEQPADGNYLVHYFAQDCAGTEELQFIKDASGSWSTSYYTFPINIDTVAPVVATPLVLSPPVGSSLSYSLFQDVTATYSCTDERSGVVKCGSQSFSSAVGGVPDTGTITSPVDTSTPGTKPYTVTAVDAAGNQSSASVSYTVAQYDAAIKITLSATTVTYPLGTNVTITVAPTGGHVPTGVVRLLDGTNLLQTSQLQGNGAAYLYIQGLAAGTHSLSAVYAGDAFNPAGASAPVTLTVKQVPVNLTAACFNANFPYGADYHCGVYASSNAGAPLGVITYQYDGGSAVTLPLQNGSAQFILPRPPVGTHAVLINYAAQGNFAAGKQVNESFTVTNAPVIVQLTPSTYYLTGGTLTLTATIQSSSAGSPTTGMVSFVDGKNTLATVQVNASGTAATTVAASALSNGSNTIRANYSGGTNYSAGSASITVTVAVAK